MSDVKLVKCIIELNKVFFPKNRTHVDSGEFAIISADILEKCENCEMLGSTIKLKGTTCKLEYLSKYKVTCKLADRHEQYGDTYEIVYINRIIDLSDKVKQANFLKSILAENVATKLLEEYDNVVEILENGDIESLIKINGIGTTSAMKLIDKYNDSKDYSSIYAELGHLGLSTLLIKKLVAHYKSPDIVCDIVKNNPYSLVEVEGIGFKKADEIANKLGISGSDPNRIKGYILHVLLQNGELGKSYMHYSELMTSVYDTLGYIEQDILNRVATQLINDGTVIAIENGEYIGLIKYYRLEEHILNELLRLNNSKLFDTFDFSNWRETIKITEQEQGFEFTDEQLKAIELFTTSNILVLTGGGGAGKTSTAKGICDLLKNVNVSACALSGKASVRITEATGINAQTIHRLLNYKFGKFQYNKTNQLKTDVVIIDEATMINGELFLQLLQAIPSGAKLVMMGDIQQLTPIGSCQVFGDLLSENQKTITSYRLNKLHRQALKSGIIPTSLKIINQEQICKSNFQGNIKIGELQDMEFDIYKEDLTPSNRVVEHFMKQYEISHNLLETQVVVPMRNRGDLCTYNLNIKIQSLINPIEKNKKHVIVNVDKDRHYCIQVGDKVINTKNNYNSINIEGENTPIFNGNIGIVKDIIDDYCIVDFIGIGEVVLNNQNITTLELGYACTIHKYQGSGCDRVIVAIDSSAYVLLNAELIYTGITRAKKYCVLVGKNNAIRTAISKREIKNKQTYLNKWLH